MRIIVLSDTHRNFRSFHEIVLRHQKEAHLFLHLGDGERDVEDISDLFPDLPLRHVRGNCDAMSMAPAVDILEVGDVRILACHGHTLGVQSGCGRLEEMARKSGCSIALYGHTHVADIHYSDGLYLMNPGSPSCPRAGKPSYGVIDILPEGIFPFLVEL